MGLFDKINKDELLSKAKGAVSTATDKVKTAAKDSSEKLNAYKKESADLKAPVEGAIIRYDVTYNGGLPQYPKEKAGAIGLNIMSDSFVLKKTISTKDWFEDFEINYDDVTSLEITKRSAGTWEMMMSSNAASARATEVENVIVITYNSGDVETKLRLEMLTGTTVYNQAKVCQEMLDVLRQNKILDRLNKASNTQTQQVAKDDPLEKIQKLAQMKDLGVITEEEFNQKKAELLSQL